MDTALTLANQVFIMFLIMSIGFCLYHFRFVAERTADDMTTVLLYIVSRPFCLIRTDVCQSIFNASVATNILQPLRCNMP